MMFKLMRGTRASFTIVELGIVLAIILVLAAMVIPLIVSNNKTVSTSVNPPGVQVEKNVPDNPINYQVHILPLPGTFSMESTRIHETLVEWLRRHPGHRLVSVIRSQDGNLVIVTEAP